MKRDLPSTQVELLRERVIREHGKISPECEGPLIEWPVAQKENRVKVHVLCNRCQSNTWFTVTHSQAEAEGML